MVIIKLNVDAHVNKMENANVIVVLIIVKRKTVNAVVHAIVTRAKVKTIVVV